MLAVSPWVGVHAIRLRATPPEGRRRHDQAFVEHLRVIEREFGGRLTPAEQNAVADALAGFWHGDQESPTTTG